MKSCVACDGVCWGLLFIVLCGAGCSCRCVEKGTKRGQVPCRLSKGSGGVAFEEAVILRLIITIPKLTDGDRGGRFRSENKMEKNDERAVTRWNLQRWD